MIRPHRTIATLALLALAACAGPGPSAPAAPTAGDVAAARASAEPDQARGTLLPLRRALESAADGLLYTSESDFPFTWTTATGPARGPLTVAAVRRAYRIADSIPVEAIPLDAFFARHIERADPNDPVVMALRPRYVRLRETLRTLARVEQVFRVGRIRIDCLAVGLVRPGTIAGLRTVSIET